MAAIALMISSAQTFAAIRTYDRFCAKPLAHWWTRRDGIGHLVPVIAIYIDDDGTIRGNKKVTIAGLRRTVMPEIAKLTNPAPQVILSIARNAPCDVVRKVRSVMDASQVCRRERPCAEGRGWRHWPISGGP